MIRNKNVNFSYISEGYTTADRWSKLTFCWFLRQPKKAAVLFIRAPGYVLSYILKNMPQFFLYKQVKSNDRGGFMYSYGTEMFHSVEMRLRSRSMRSPERHNNSKIFNRF